MKFSTSKYSNSSKVVVRRSNLWQGVSTNVNYWLDRFLPQESKISLFISTGISEWCTTWRRQRCCCPRRAGTTCTRRSSYFFTGSPKTPPRKTSESSARLSLTLVPLFIHLTGVAVYRGLAPMAVFYRAPNNYWYVLEEQDSLILRVSCRHSLADCSCRPPSTPSKPPLSYSFCTWNTISIVYCFTNCIKANETCKLNASSISIFN